MIILNADDWGRSAHETDAAVSCLQAQRITSVTAMVFMEDSIRSAEIGCGQAMEIGLHLNLSQSFNGEGCPASLRERHEQIVSFLTSSKFSQLFYNPMLDRAVRYVYAAQYEEFERLYGRRPSHIDGHHHMHLCANMVWGHVISEGERVRRNFTYRAGQKSLLNRYYRRLIDAVLARRYRLTDYLFSLAETLRGNDIGYVAKLARKECVEVMTHPGSTAEHAYLMSDEFGEILRASRTGTYSQL